MRPASIPGAAPEIPIPTGPTGLASWAAIPTLMPSVKRASPQVSERLVARASELGFPDPPVDVRLKLLHGPTHWSLYIQAIPPASAEAVAEWIHPFAPLRIEFGSREILRADFDPLPSPWRSGIGRDVIDHLSIDTSGAALVSMTGLREDLARFTRTLRGPVAPLEIRHVAPTITAPGLLTAPQADALRYAVGSGYYKIPRPLNLRQLAQRLGISSASLSERLRRAEGRVLTRYVLAGGRTPWDARTLYDDRPLIPGGPAWPDGRELEEK